MRRNWFILLAVCLILNVGFIVLGPKPPQEANYMVLPCACGILLIFHLLKIVLGADESYRLKLQTQVCDIYVYKNNFDADVIIIQNGKETHVETRRGEEGYRFYRNCSFAYNPVDEDCWFYLSPTSDEPQRLGKKVYYGIGDSVFLEGITDGSVNLCVLHDTGIIRIKADWFGVGAYVPPKARSNMKYETGSHIKPIENLPEEYLIVKKGDQFVVYGLSNTWTKKPKCLKIDVSAIIFQYINKRVVLVKENNKYRVLCSKLVATRWLNDVIAELSDSNDGSWTIGGTVWRFNEETNQLEKLYEGRYWALGFDDGSIIGDNFKYTPEDGFEHDLEVD